MGMADFDAMLAEFTLVGAGIRGGFTHTPALNVMNYKQAMRSTNKETWKRAVDNQYHRML